MRALTTLARTGAVVLCALLFLLPAAPALAAPRWLAPVHVSLAGQKSPMPQVAVDADGDAVAVWERWNGTNYIVQAASRAAGGGWQAPVDLSAAGGSATRPQVAVDPRGDAVAVWGRWNGTDRIIQAASRAAGGGWQAPVDLSATGQSADEPHVA